MQNKGDSPYLRQERPAARKVTKMRRTGARGIKIAIYLRLCSPQFIFANWGDVFAGRRPNPWDVYSSDGFSGGVAPVFHSNLTLDGSNLPPGLPSLAPPSWPVRGMMVTVHR